MTIYDKYKNDPLWEKIEKLLFELKENQDIEVTTNIDYVIWYLVKNIKDKNKY